MGKSVVTKEKWLDAGVIRFGESGLAGLKVEAMARDLGSSKAGFYWYFDSREAFERELFGHWREQSTRRIIVAADAATTPIERLLTLFIRAIEARKTGDFLFFFRRLARKRKPYARLLEEIEAERIAYLAEVLVALGKDRATSVEAAEAVYHLYLGWSERHRHERVTEIEARKQLAVVGALVGLDLSARKERHHESKMSRYSEAVLGEFTSWRRTSSSSMFGASSSVTSRAGMPARPTTGASTTSSPSSTEACARRAARAWPGCACGWAMSSAGTTLPARCPSPDAGSAASPIASRLPTARAIGLRRTRRRRSLWQG